MIEAAFAVRETCLKADWGQVNNYWKLFRLLETTCCCGARKTEDFQLNRISRAITIYLDRIYWQYFKQRRIHKKKKKLFRFYLLLTKSFYSSNKFSFPNLSSPHPRKQWERERERTNSVEVDRKCESKNKIKYFLLRSISNIHFYYFALTVLEIWDIRKSLSRSKGPEDSRRTPKLTRHQGTWK